MSEIIKKGLPIEEDVGKEWVCLKTIVQRAAEEALGKRSSRQNHKRLKIWNNKLSREVKRKQNLFWKRMSSKNEQDKGSYKEQCCKIRKMIRETGQEQYKMFMANMERDTYKPKPKVYKIIKRISEDEVHRANIAPPDCKKMVEYYVNLWSDPNSEVVAASMSHSLGKS